MGYWGVGLLIAQPKMGDFVLSGAIINVYDARYPCMLLDKLDEYPIMSVSEHLLIVQSKKLLVVYARSSHEMCNMFCKIYAFLYSVNFINV